MKFFLAWVLMIAGSLASLNAANAASGPSTAGVSLSQSANAGSGALAGKSGQSANAALNNGPRVKPRFPIQVTMPIQKRAPIQPRI